MCTSKCHYKNLGGEISITSEDLTEHLTDTTQGPPSSITTSTLTTNVPTTTLPPILLVIVITAIMTALLATVIFVLVLIAVCKCWPKFTPGGAETTGNSTGEREADYEDISARNELAATNHTYNNISVYNNVSAIIDRGGCDSNIELEQNEAYTTSFQQHEAPRDEEGIATERVGNGFQQQSETNSVQDEFNGPTYNNLLDVSAMQGGIATERVGNGFQQQSGTNSVQDEFNGPTYNNLLDVSAMQGGIATERVGNSFQQQSEINSAQDKFNGPTYNNVSAIQVNSNCKALIFIEPVNT